MQSDELLKKEIGEAFTVIGEWWVPRPPDPLASEFKHFGTLTFDPNEEKGITLEVLGLLNPDVDSNYDYMKQFFESRSVDRHEIILGISTAGERITLFDCFGTGSSGGRYSYLSRLVFASKRRWFTSEDDLKFKTLKINYSNLNEWVGLSSIHISSPFDFCTTKKQTVSFEKPDLLTSAEVGNYIVSIAIGGYFRSLGSPPHTATIEQDTSFQVRAKGGEISHLELFRLELGIGNFISLTSNEPVFTLVIEASAPVEDEPPATTRVLYEPVRTSSKKDSSSRHMLFTYSSVADIFESALQKVVEDENMQPLYDQFFAEFHNPSTFVENRFMAVVRAIEVFHRRTSVRDYYVPETEYKGEDGLLKDLMKPVNEARIETDFRKSLKRKLEYGYQYSLRRRLKELLNEYGSEFFSLFVTKKMPDFIEEVVVTRNWLTHFDEDDRKGAVTGKELAYLSGRLEILLTILLFNYIGIPQETIEGAIRHHSESDFMKFGWLRPNSLNAHFSIESALHD